MSDRICIESNGKFNIKISSENILACCKNCGLGCDGGYPDSAFWFWKNSGIPTGGLYKDPNTCQPYSFPPCDHHVNGTYGPCGKEEFKTPKCKNTCQEGYPLAYDTDKWYASDVYGLETDEQQIMSEIFEHGSVEASFAVYEDFLNYKKGIYQHVAGGYLGGHAIKIIGWGVEKGSKYWIIVNSWNEGWGEKGTVRFLRGENHLGIENSIVTGIPKIKSIEELIK